MRRVSWHDGTFGNAICYIRFFSIFDADMSCLARASLLSDERFMYY